jgi:hypothetical protein
MITKSVIENMINEADLEKKGRIIGRACIVLFKRQTDSEKAANTTNVENMEGFTSSDARQGSITAKYFLKHGKLEEWQVKQWTKINVKGTMRIAKYHRQLNEAAIQKKGAA